MIKNYMNVFAVLLVILATQMNGLAQNRNTNIELILESPTANAVIPYGGQFDVTIAVKNNGPDSLRATDTLLFWHSALEEGKAVGTLLTNLTGSGGLASGETSPFGNLTQLTNDNNDGTDQTVNFCVVALDVNTADLVSEDTGEPLLVTWDDTDTSNNTTCVPMTLEAQDPSAISDIDDSREPLVMSPNPANTEVGFLLDLETPATVNVSVKDIQGREVLKKDFGRVASGNKVHLKLDISGLKSGVYFVELNNNGKKSVGKLSVQH